MMKKTLHRKLRKLIEERNIFLSLPEDASIQKKAELSMIARSIINVSSSEVYDLTTEEIAAIDWARDYLRSN